MYLLKSVKYQILNATMYAGAVFFKEGVNGRDSSNTVIQLTDLDTGKDIETDFRGIEKLLNEHQVFKQFSYGKITVASVFSDKAYEISKYLEFVGTTRSFSASSALSVFPNLSSENIDKLSNILSPDYPCTAEAPRRNIHDEANLAWGNLDFVKSELRKSKYGVCRVNSRSEYCFHVANVYDLILFMNFFNVLFLPNNTLALIRYFAGRDITKSMVEDEIHWYAQMFKYSPKLLLEMI